MTARRSVFVCYQRDDASDAAGRLHDHLVDAYGAERVFMHIDSVPLGVNLVRHIERQLLECDAVLVLIGRVCATIKDLHGDPRREDPADHVRIEVATALKQGPSDPGFCFRTPLCHSLQTFPCC